MNCSDWEREIAEESESAGLAEHLWVCEHCREFARELEKNSVALREFAVPAAAFTAVRHGVLSKIQVRRRAMWWTWSAVAAAACVAILCAAYPLPRFENPAGPKAVLAKMDPPKIGWTPRPVHHHSSGRLVAQATPARKTEPLAVIKMLTDDPNVIIIWLVDQKGDSL